jgi:hypothetical protein
MCELDPETQQYRIFARDYEKYKKELCGEKTVEKRGAELDKSVSGYLKFLNNNLHTVLGQNGEPLPTQTGYALFIKHFEAFAAENPSLELINASVGGAQINGYKNIPLENVVFQEAFDKQNLGEMPIKYDFSNLESELHKTKELLTKTIEELCVILEMTIKLKKEFRPKNIEKAREKLTARISAFHDNYFAKHPVIYFRLYKHFTRMQRISEPQKLEKLTRVCIKSLCRLRFFYPKDSPVRMAFISR